MTSKWQRLFIPPCGPSVRLLIAWYTLWVGLPRIFDLTPGALLPLRFLPPEVYGWLMTALGLALLVTCLNGWRRRWWGRAVAAAAFVVWVMLAAAAPSATSILINATTAACLLHEVWSVRGCGDA